MHQITEMMISLMKERGVAESPNFQEKSVQEKSNNQKVRHPGRSKFISHHAQMPFVRQLVSPELNSRANTIDPIDVSNLDHLFG